MNASTPAPVWWPTVSALPAVRLRCRLDTPANATLPTPGQIRGAIGHRLMALADTAPLACFFPSVREDRQQTFLGHASPWALHVSDDGVLEIAVFADGLAHFGALLQALMAAAGERVGDCDRLALHRFEHQPELVDGEWQPGLPPRPGQWRLPGRPSGELDLVLLSPLRIRRQGRDLTPSELQPRDVFSHLMRRTSALLQQSGLPLPAWDARAMLDDVAGLAFTAQWLERTALARYSKRQQQAMRLVGLRGVLRLPAGLPPDFWPLLWMGQALHLGKTPCLGMGRYALAGTG